MPLPPVCRAIFLLLFVCGAFGVSSSPLAAEQQTTEPAAREQPTGNPPARQAKLEAALAKMLSGATLEGSFTNTSAGSDPTKLSREKYTLGDVKKLAGELWQIPARIQYGGKDVTLPIVLPIRWAGDTPVVAVDQLPLPGFGTVSARVMFFDGHYAGYWKHGDRGGHLFGIIHSDEDKTSTSAPSQESRPASRGDVPANK